MPMKCLWCHLSGLAVSENISSEIMQISRQDTSTVDDGSYLLVWAVTRIVLLLMWSIPVNYFFMHFEIGQQQHHQLQIVYGTVQVIAGLYQFSSLKTKCLRYCESPLSFFMRRWKSGSIGAIRMGTYHGLYCLGCCWRYFLVMVALGWMNLLWMALFAGVIFGEKTYGLREVWD